MSWVRIWVHFVFSTKNRHPFLNAYLRAAIFERMRQTAIEKGIWLERINGYTDHCHCLVSLTSEQSASKVAQFIKGESSRWINANGLVKNFEWQDDYYAVSVSESQVDAIRRYIDNQEAHHRRKSFRDEKQEFNKKFRFDPQVKKVGKSN